MQDDGQHASLLSDVEGLDEEVQVLLQAQVILLTNLLEGVDQLHQVVQEHVLPHMGAVQVLPHLYYRSPVPHSLLVHRPQAPLHQYSPQSVSLQVGVANLKISRRPWNFRN
jgi:hypothetical protein